MLYIKIQPQNFLVILEEDIKVFLPYIGMVAILFSGVEPLSIQLR